LKEFQGPGNKKACPGGNNLVTAVSQIILHIRTASTECPNEKQATLDWLI
jgi:hypothetical protein